MPAYNSAIESARPSDETDVLGDEAKADSAPVADAPYTPRRKWKPGNVPGYIINTTPPVARLKWPKRREGKEFLARTFNAGEKIPPAIPANSKRGKQQ